MEENGISIEQEKKSDRRDEILNHSDIETIVLFLIDKIIINAIHESNKKIINDKLNLYCYNFMQNQLNHFMKTNFLFYENNNEGNKEKIFYNNKLENYDKWITFTEPNNIEKDRNNSNMIKIVKCIKTNNKEIDFNKTNKKNSFNELVELENGISPGKIDKKVNDKIKKNFNKIKNMKIINKLLYNNKKQKLKDKTQIMDLNYIDLEKEKYFNIYSEMNKNEEYNILRKEKEKKRKEEKRLFLEKTLKLLEANKNRILPNIDSKSFSFDSNGKILTKHLFPINKLKKEFLDIKSKLSEDKTKKNKIIRSLIKASKSTNNLELLDKNNINSKNQEIIENNKNEINSNKSKNNVTKNENNNEVDKTDTIKYKKLSLGQIKINKESKGDITEKYKNSKIKIDFNPKDKEKQYSYDIKYKQNLDNIEITPSGSNLEKIIPVTGVVLKYNKNKREGGFNYFKKYNRPSMDEYKQLSLSYSPSKIQDVLLFSNINNFSPNNNIYNSNSKEIINDYNKVENNSLKYNGYKEKFDDNNNPLIKNAHKISSEYNKELFVNSPSVKNLKNEINNRNHKNIILSDDLRRKKFIIDERNMSNSLIFQNSIQLSNKNNSNNLYHYFSDLSNDLINDSNIKNEINRNDSSKIILNENILGNNSIIQKNYKLPTIKKAENEKYKMIYKNEMDQMAKFNFDIIKNIKKKYWGNNLINSKSNNEIPLNYSRKPILFNNSKLNKKIRERKNMLNKINNIESIDYQKLLVS